MGIFGFNCTCASEPQTIEQYLDHVFCEWCQLVSDYSDSHKSAYGVRPHSFIVEPTIAELRAMIASLPSADDYDLPRLMPLAGRGWRVTFNGDPEIARRRLIEDCGL